jgi:hypothetical protein
MHVSKDIQQLRTWMMYKAAGNRIDAPDCSSICGRTLDCCSINQLLLQQGMP